MTDLIVFFHRVAEQSYNWCFTACSNISLNTSFQLVDYNGVGPWADHSLYLALRSIHILLHMLIAAN